MRGWRIGGSLCAGAILLAACAPVVGSRALSPDQALAAGLSGMIWPLPIEQAYRVTSPYGPRGRRHHDGLDIDGEQGDPIYAAREGRIAFSGWKNGYGQTVIIDHGRGVATLYGHTSARYVAAGEAVARGQVVAAVGTTGNARGSHLHFEVVWAGVPLDPRPLLPTIHP
jgi:murein DD-endopeptidase MepM/ murein hydrolase activator NlpD